MTQSELSEQELIQLGDAVMALVDRKEYESAKILIEFLVAVPFAPPPLLVTYALCLDELGEHEQAQQVFAAVKQQCEGRGGAIGKLIASAEPWLPGGEQWHPRPADLRKETAKRRGR